MTSPTNEGDANVLAHSEEESQEAQQVEQARQVSPGWGLLLQEPCPPSLHPGHND